MKNANEEAFVPIDVQSGNAGTRNQQEKKSMQKLTLIVLLSLLLSLTGCKNDDNIVQPANYPQVEKNIEASTGGVLSTSNSFVLTIPPNALPTSGTVFLGRTGNEPTEVKNKDLQIVGQPMTIRIPCDSIRSTLQLSFPLSTVPTSLENYSVFLYNGSTYFPVPFVVNGTNVTVEIDKPNWETSSSLAKTHTSNGNLILGDIIVFGVNLAQTPPSIETGLKEVVLSPSGTLLFAEPSASPGSKVVVFVHGWTGRPGVWKTMLQRIKGETDLAYSHFWTFGYNSSLSISDNGDRLRQALSRSTNGAKVDIIGHSMGGLVSRSMIEQHDGAQFVNRLVTLGTPHTGSPIAAFRGYVGALVLLESGFGSLSNYCYFTQGGKDLATSSSFIEQMKTLSRPVVPYYLIAVTNDPTKWPFSRDHILPGLDDGLVTEASAHGAQGATFPQSVNIPGGMVHSAMLEENAVYQQVVSYLRTGTVAGDPTTDGLVAFFPFNGNVNDESGAGLNLTNNGGAFVADRFGTTNKAINFTGTPNHLIRSGGFSVDTSLTISAWVKPSASSGEWADVVGLGNSSQDLRIGFTPTTMKPGFDAWFTGPATGIMATHSSVSLNQWTHIVGVKSGKSWSIYLNGTMDSTRIAGTGTISNVSFSVSKHPGPYSQSYFKGTIDDVRLYRRALTAAEVLALYHEKGW